MLLYIDICLKCLPHFYTLIENIYSNNYDDKKKVSFINLYNHNRESIINTLEKFISKKNELTNLMIVYNDDILLM